MSWHTEGPGSSKTTRSGAHPVHSVTGATTPREHRQIKHQQATERNALTIPACRRKYRTDLEYKRMIDQEHGEERLTMDVA